MKTLGSEIVWWRKARGLSQHRLASDAGVNVDTIRRLEQPAQSANVTIRTLERIAYALHVTPGELLDGNHELQGGEHA